MTFWNEVKSTSEWIEERIKDPLRVLTIAGLLALFIVLFPEAALITFLYVAAGTVLALYAAIPTFFVFFLGSGILLGISEIYKAITDKPHDSFKDTFSLAFDIAKVISLTVGFICGGFIPVGVGLLVHGASTVVGNLLAKGLSYVFATVGVAVERFLEPAQVNTYNITLNEQYRESPQVGEQGQFVGEAPTVARATQLLQDAQRTATNPSISTASSPAPGAAVNLPQPTHVSTPAAYPSVQPRIYGNSWEARPQQTAVYTYPSASVAGTSYATAAHAVHSPYFFSPLPGSNPYQVPGVHYHSAPGDATLPLPHSHFSHGYPSADVDGGLGHHSAHISATAYHPPTFM